VIVCEPPASPSGGPGRHWGVSAAFVGHGGRGAAALASRAFLEELAARMPQQPFPDGADRNSPLAFNYASRVRLAVTAAFLAVHERLRRHAAAAASSSDGGDGGGNSGGISISAAPLAGASSLLSSSGSSGASPVDPTLTPAGGSPDSWAAGLLSGASSPDTSLGGSAGSGAAGLSPSTSAALSGDPLAVAQSASLGATATVVVQTGQLLTVASVGSCRAVLDVGVARVELTEDDKLGCNEDEDDRLSMGELGASVCPSCKKGV
jgi:hypothetical protein